MLQRELSSDVMVVNAGVGGYGGDQACRKADKLSRAEDFESLVYIACDNDFQNESPSQVMQGFSRIKDRFRLGVCVLYTPYLQYVQGDLIFGGDGSASWNEKGDQRREGCRSACQDHGLAFIDLTDHIRSHRQEKRTVFAGLELYSDHCHLSVAGNRLAAALLASRLYRKHDDQKVTQK